MQDQGTTGGADSSAGKMRDTIMRSKRELERHSQGYQRGIKLSSQRKVLMQIRSVRRQIKEDERARVELVRWRSMIVEEAGRYSHHRVRPVGGVGGGAGGRGGGGAARRLTPRGGRLQQLHRRDHAQ